MRPWATIAAALSSALLLWASSPPVGAGWLAWLALVPVATVALAAPAARSARLAVPLAYALYLELLLVPALPFGLTHNQWGEPVVPILIGDSPVLVVATVAVPAFGLALYAAHFPQPFAGGGGVLIAVLVPALSWTALDLLRVKFDPSGLWGPLFLSQQDTAAARLAALGGPWLVTFAIVVVNYSVALVLVRRRAGLRWAAGTGALALVLVTATAALEPRRAGGSSRIRVAAVQPGYDTSEFERPVLRYFRRATRNYELAALEIIRDLGPLTRGAARGGARIVVWPEAAVWVDPRRTASTARALRRLSRATGAVLVVPYFLRAQAQGAAVAVLPNGVITRPQPKQRPMWFLGEDGGNAAPPEPVDVGSGRLGTMLGVDNQDPGSPRALAARHADLISASTHDWQQLAPQQRAFARLHAAALRVPIVRADWRYGSAVYDAGGRELADAGSEKRRGVVVAEVTTAGNLTLYARLGDWFGWAALAATLALWVVARRRRPVNRLA